MFPNFIIDEFTVAMTLFAAIPLVMVVLIMNCKECSLKCCLFKKDCDK